MVVLREFKSWLTEMKDLKLHVSFNTNVQEWIHKAKYFTGVPVWKYTGKITLHMYSVIEWNREIMTEQTGIRIGPPDSLVRCSSNEAIWHRYLKRSYWYIPPSKMNFTLKYTFLAKVLSPGSNLSVPGVDTVPNDPKWEK